MRTIKTILNDMLNETISGLEESIIKDILYLEEQDMLEYMKNVIDYGVASGIVGSLIYVGDVNDFFKENFEEIFELYNELKEEGLNVDFDLSATNLSYLAYEYTMERLYNEVVSVLEDELEEY